MLGVPTFTGGPQNASSDWNNPSNWDTMMVPQDGDDVTIGDHLAWATPIYPGGTLNLNNLSLGEESLTFGGGDITVGGTFSWTGGWITDGGTLTVNNMGLVTTSDPAISRGPSLGNTSILQVNGTLTIAGGGNLWVDGGQCQVLNSGKITLAGAGLRWLSGTSPLIENDGVITVIGSAALDGGTINNSITGSVTIGPASELIVKGGGILRLTGGGLSGGGVLSISSDDQGYGTLSVETDTVLPKDLTLKLSGIGYVSSATVPLKVTPRLQIQGKAELSGGTLYYAHVVLLPSASCSITGTSSSIYGGTFDNEGVSVVAPNSVWTLTSGATLNNRGRLSLSGNSGINHVGGVEVFNNIGLFESLGTERNQLSAVALTNTGNLVLVDGGLDIIVGTVLTVSGGVVYLQSADLASSDMSGSLVLTGGTTGGVLRGAGNVGASVNNAGIVEPLSSGLKFQQGYAQSDQGALVLSLGALGSGSVPPMTVSGTASLAGSLFITN
jgi:hypothetical protein